jgi:hypothetical protein
MANSAPKDLSPTGPQKLSWEKGKIVDSLESLFERITGDAEAAINWYIHAKRPKKNAARTLRAGSILAGTIAGLIPVLAQIFTNNGQPRFQPAWASVALGIAAALVLLDRFFGFSSAWMRYVATELTIQQLNKEFHLDWDADKAVWLGVEPTPEQLRGTLTRFRSFVTQVNAIIKQETDAWIQEFQTTLKQIDDAAKAKSTAAELGAINITLANGDACENGWILTIDEGSATAQRGKTAAVHDLVPGVHKLKANGTIAGTAKQAEAAVTVGAGAPASVQLTLS